MSNIIKATLKRTREDEFGMHGQLHVTDEVLCYTLEPPWKDNETDISCIPKGEYLVTLHYSPKFSPKFGEVFILDKVKDRDNILIHPGNWVHETQGCILVGLDRTDEMLLESVMAFNLLKDKFGRNHVELTIVEDY